MNCRAAVGATAGTEVRNESEIRKVQMSEMHHRTDRRRKESASPFEQDARHDDCQKVEGRKVAVDTARPIDGPGDQKQIDRIWA